MQEVPTIKVICASCGESNRLTYDVSIGYETVNCSRCGYELGRISDLRPVSEPDNNPGSEPGATGLD